MKNLFWAGLFCGFVALLAFWVVGGLSAGRPSITTAIRVWHDDQRGVTCWVAEGKNDEAAISCMQDAAFQVKP